MIYLYASQNRVERMKDIALKLNALLRPVLRVRPRPLAVPLSPEDLAEIHARTAPKPEPEVAAVNAAQQTEKEKLWEIHRRVSRPERALYMRILEQGTVGVDNESLYSEMEEEYGYPRAVVKVALERLAKAKHIVVAATVPGVQRSASPSAAASSSSSVPFKEIPGARRMSIEVEKISSGHAVVWVDGRWRGQVAARELCRPEGTDKEGEELRRPLLTVSRGRRRAPRDRQASDTGQTLTWAKLINAVMLTGANSDGKTTLLNTVASIHILTLLGLPVPAESAEVTPMPVYLFRKRTARRSGSLEHLLRSPIPILADRQRKLVLIDELEALTEARAAGRIIASIINKAAATSSLFLLVTHLAKETLPYVKLPVRVDGIEASGLDAKGELEVDRQPVFDHIGSSTPKLIVMELAKASRKETLKAIYKDLLASLEGEAGSPIQAPIAFPWTEEES